MTAVHHCSSRNGAQVRVRGLKLAAMGYRFGASVTVQDANNPDETPWTFVVPNNEFATMSCKLPRAPDWVRPGTLLRVTVQ
jgi:hypothetical protein